MDVSLEIGGVESGLVELTGCPDVMVIATVAVTGKLNGSMIEGNASDCKPMIG
jgi:hypothetical protein